MTKKRLPLHVAAALIAGLPLLVLAVPRTRELALGLLHGERVYQMRPTSYWEQAVADWDRTLQDATRDDDLVPPAVLRGDRQAVPVLADLLRSKKEVVRVRAAEALVRTDTGDLAVRFLLDALHSEDELFRLAAAAALSGKRSAAEQTVPALLRALNDKSEAVREVAAETLKSLDPEAASRAGLLPAVTFDRNTDRVACHDPAGRVQWATPLEGDLVLVRPPHLVWNAERVYATHGDGVTALDKHTGKVLWHARGPGDRLYISGDLLLATDGSPAADLVGKGRWVVARAVADGVEVFRVPLPREDFDPEVIREAAGLFLVQREAIYEVDDGRFIDRRDNVVVRREDIAVPWDGFLFDRGGQVWHRLAFRLLGGKSLDRDVVVLTPRGVVRLSPDDDAVWTVRLGWSNWTADGGLADLPGGDVLAFVYDRTSHSGVEVRRIDVATGRSVWTQSCHAFTYAGWYTKYEHRATVVVDADRVRVTSRESHGNFLEVLDLATGRQLSRRRY
jgi:HEAT repeats/PQQ-like domain